MAMVSMRQLLDEAAAGDYGVGAFNVNNMEQIQAIMEAARETASPVIIQASRGRPLVHERPLPLPSDAGRRGALPRHPGRLHQDHGNSPETCFSAIELGFTSVMMDGSLLADGKTPSDFDYNVAVTRRGRRATRTRAGSRVEGELGTLGGIEDGARLGRGAPDRPGPGGRVRRARPGIDALAVAIGTSHGAYKFTQPPEGEVLAMDLIEEIHEQAAGRRTSSCTAPRRCRRTLVDMINAYGGADPPDVGRARRRDPARHPPRRAQDQRRHRLATRDHRRDPQGRSPRAPAEFDPRSYLEPARAAMQSGRSPSGCTQFGQAGHAGDYEPRSLADMRDFYAGAAA